MYCHPRLERITKPARELVVKRTRRMDEYRKKKLADWIQHESWQELDDSKNKAQTMIEVVSRKLDEICPKEEVRVSQMDGKINSLALQKLGRQKQREYSKHGCSNKFKAIKKKMKARIRLEGEKSIDKMLENAERKGLGWIQEANRLSARPGEDIGASFNLPAHIDANFTALQSAEAIADHFSKISQEYTPIEDDTSPRWMEVKEQISNAKCIHPLVFEHEKT